MCSKIFIPKYRPSAIGRHTLLQMLFESKACNSMCESGSSGTPHAGVRHAHGCQSAPSAAFPARRQRLATASLTECTTNASARILRYAYQGILYMVPHAYATSVPCSCADVIAPSSSAASLDPVPGTVFQIYIILN